MKCHDCAQRGIAVTRAKSELGRLARMAARSDSARPERLAALREAIAKQKEIVRDQTRTRDEHAAECEVAA